MVGRKTKIKLICFCHLTWQYFWNLIKTLFLLLMFSFVTSNIPNYCIYWVNAALPHIPASRYMKHENPLFGYRLSHIPCLQLPPCLTNGPVCGTYGSHTGQNCRYKRRPVKMAGIRGMYHCIFAHRNSDTWY